MSIVKQQTIKLTNDTGDYANVHLYGATVTSWNVEGKNLLFMSSKSKTDGTKAVRGGIPIVFPNFGPWDLGPQHGFARIHWWTVNQPPHKLENGDVEAIFELKDSDEIRKMWNYKFCLRYKVLLGKKKLDCSLEIVNAGTERFDFTTLLHSYFHVSNIKECLVDGFTGCKYNDKVTGNNDMLENLPELSIAENVDRVYRDTKSHVLKSGDHKVKISKRNLPDTVLWNPWKEKAKAMSDFNDDGYLNMICVEPGYVSSKKKLQPGESFTCGQLLEFLS